MDYHKHYNLLIEKAKHRILEGYCESHHIIPKCMGGGDEPDNLVDLTPEEHFLAHQLLVKIHPRHLGIIRAANMMCSANKLHKRKGNKLFGWLRRHLIESQKGHKISEETRRKIGKANSVALKGRKQTHESNLKRSEKLKGRRTNSNSYKGMTAEERYGKDKAEEMSQKARERLLGKPRMELRKPKKTIVCPHCFQSGENSQMKRWHFDNCKKHINKCE